MPCQLVISVVLETLSQLQAEGIAAMLTTGQPSREEGHLAAAAT